ncbi:transposase [Candidatus Peregrinibacteria bacterium]|nr:MAG: transposase [Candidatus Peregrinibacteria bacterium]
MNYKVKKKFRLSSYNYAWDGHYFITICTKNREDFLGKIIDKQMYLSEMGTIVDQIWHEIAEHFEGFEVDEWVIMPDHVHGIIKINQEACESYDAKRVRKRRNMINHVPTFNDFPGDHESIHPFPIDFYVPLKKGFGINQTSGQYGIINNPMQRTQTTLAKAVRWFKAKVTHAIRKILTQTSAGKAVIMIVLFAMSGTLPCSGIHKTESRSMGKQ